MVFQICRGRSVRPSRQGRKRVCRHWATLNGSFLDRRRASLCPCCVASTRGRLRQIVTRCSSRKYWKMAKKTRNVHGFNDCTICVWMSQSRVDITVFVTPEGLRSVRNQVFVQQKLQQYSRHNIDTTTLNKHMNFVLFVICLAQCS